MQAVALVVIGLLGVGCGIFLLIGRKPLQPAQSPHVETAADILRSSPAFDRTMLKQRFLAELKREQPPRPYQSIVIQHFASLSGAYADAIDATVAWALSDPDIAAARAALAAHGYAVDIGTYEEPGHRALYLGVRSADAGVTKRHM